jgi:ribosomal protein S18 acetylase RimI-like enzyme
VDPRIRIRAFQPTDAEYEAVARVNALAPEGERQDFEPRSGADLKAFDASFDPARHVLRRHVAEEAGTGRIVGAAHCFHMPWMSDPSRFWCAVRCDPAYRRRGIGGRLYAEAMADLTRLGAAAVRMMARETMPEMVALLTRRGYREVLRSWEFELELDRAGDPPTSVLPPGIAIEPLPDLVRRDPTWLPRLHALYVAVLREVPLPGFPRADPPPGWLSDHLQRWPTSLPDACLVATDAGRYVGLCVLHRNEDDPARLDHLLTGVAADHRGRGVGVALKLATIAYGKRRGYRSIWTAVESNNPRMLALNERLGFTRKGGLILLEADL